MAKQLPHRKASSDSAPEASPETPPGSLASPSRDHAADYIAEMTGELAALARRSDLELLAYLLDMCRSEAVAETNRRRRAAER